MLTKLTESNYTIESCILATNVEADMLELIMNLNHQTRHKKSIVSSQPKAAERPREEAPKKKKALTKENMFDLISFTDPIQLFGWELQRNSANLKLFSDYYFSKVSSNTETANVLDSIFDAPGSNTGVVIKPKFTIEDILKDLPSIKCDLSLDILDLKMKISLLLNSCSIYVSMDSEENETNLNNLKQYANNLDFLTKKNVVDGIK